MYDNFLLFTDTYQKQIYQMDLTSGGFHAVPLSGHDNPIAVDYDPVHRRVYWTDVAGKLIRRACINGSHEENVLPLAPSNQPFPLTILETVW